VAGLVAKATPGKDNEKGKGQATGKGKGKRADDDDENYHQASDYDETDEAEDGEERGKERIAANLRALADEADKELALLDDADSFDGMRKELDTSKDMGSLLHRISDQEHVMEEDMQGEETAEHEANNAQMGQEAQDVVVDDGAEH
jgi:hypothetical protein